MVMSLRSGKVASGFSHSFAADIYHRYIISMPNFYLLVGDPSSKSQDNWRNIHSRIVALCDRIWEEVKPVLCIDSPEGHTDEPIEELGVGPKDILSYSWRGLRESRYTAPKSPLIDGFALMELASCCMPRW